MWRPIWEIPNQELVGSKIDYLPGPGVEGHGEEWQGQEGPGEAWCRFSFGGAGFFWAHQCPDLTPVIEMTSFEQDVDDTWGVADTGGIVEKFTSLTLFWIYALAGKATFTIESVGTKRRFTYKIERKPKEHLWFISVLCGPDNKFDFTYLGCFIGENQKYVRDKQLRIGRDAPSRKAFEWLVGRINRDQSIADLCTIWHEGKCGRCGRALTTPDSIRTGLGPTCKVKALE